jgi:hypothetical protein
MPGKVPLSIARYVQATDYNPSPDWLLPNRGADFLAVPGDVMGKTDIDRFEPCHRMLLLKIYAAAKPAPSIAWQIWFHAFRVPRLKDPSNIGGK